LKFHSGDRQGCVLSPLFFGIVIDWVSKTSMLENTGISWLDGTTLSGLDFADDIVLLHDSWEGMQTSTSALEKEAKKVGLVINVSETKTC